MSRKKNEVREGSRAIAKAILEEYQPTSVEEMQEALREIFGPMFEAMPQGEMEAHLGYASQDRGGKVSGNRRNGYTEKTVKSSMGDIEIRTPRDREGSFAPQIIPKRTKDVSGIEDKVLRSISILAPGVSVELNTGQKALVLADNEQNILEPMILMFGDNSIVDLSDRDMFGGLEIKDIMKTMDNRHVMDMDLLKKQGIKVEEPEYVPVK